MRSSSAPSRSESVEQVESTGCRSLVEDANLGADVEAKTTANRVFCETKVSKRPPDTK